MTEISRKNIQDIKYIMDENIRRGVVREFEPEPTPESKPVKYFPTIKIELDNGITIWPYMNG